jgi:aryl-alcohol dehydrogenase-like predicted oxidoreductase
VRLAAGLAASGAAIGWIVLSTPSLVRDVTMARRVSSEEALKVEMRTLGNAGPEISVVGYGAWEAGGADWGPNRSDEDVIASMRAALDAGMNWIDTAEVYGQGRSEDLVARAVGGRRDDVLIFTKVAPDDEGSGIRPHEIQKAVRGSLRRLRTDRIDLYQIHWPDERVPVEDSWGTMIELVDEGLVRHIGVSNFDQPLLERCLALSHVDSCQNAFSLLEQDDRPELLPWLDGKGIGYLAYGPLGFGLLTGALGRETTFEEGDWRAKERQGHEGLFASGTFERSLQLVERLRAVGERLGVALAPLALRWVVQQLGVTAAIAGSRNPRHVTANATAGDLRLDGRALREIEAIFS